MKDLIFIRPRFFYMLMLPFIILGGILLVVTAKSDFFILLNSYHHPFADQFFIYITWLGNGLIFFLICFFIFLKNKGHAILGLLSFAVSALIPQLLKKLVFSDSIRPVKFFENNDHLHLVEGVKHHMNHSFPSGHATSAFALAFFLTLIVKDKRWGLVFSLLAIVTAYSRIYLAQHFFEDIYAGACIGLFSTLLVFILLEKWILTKENLKKGLL